MGIYMREGLDMACEWGSSGEGNYVFLGHQFYSNYDGKGSKVSGDYVPCTSSDPDLYSFGARNGAKNFVILVNRNHELGKPGLPSVRFGKTPRARGNSFYSRAGLFSDPRGRRNSKIIVPIHF
jgi:hypothetical protein